MIIDANVHITADGKWFTTPHDASVERLHARKRFTARCLGRTLASVH
jgi:hypothetical protein